MVDVDPSRFNDGVSAGSSIIGNASVWFGEFVSSITFWFSSITWYEWVLVVFLVIVFLVLRFLKAKIKDKVDDKRRFY